MILSVFLELSSLTFGSKLVENYRKFFVDFNELKLKYSHQLERSKQSPHTVDGSMWFVTEGRIYVMGGESAQG
jgi:hypothetical protein